MKNSQYLLIAAIGLFLLVIIAGTALLVVPLLLDRQAQELPTSAPTEPVVVFPGGGRWKDWRGHHGSDHPAHRRSFVHRPAHNPGYGDDSAFGHAYTPSV